MNICFCDPPFNDWCPIIKNLQIPNIFIIKNKDINVDHLVNLIKNNNFIIPLRYEHIKFIIDNIPSEHISKCLCPTTYDSIEILDNKT